MFITPLCLPSLPLSTFTYFNVFFFKNSLQAALLQSCLHIQTNMVAQLNDKTYASLRVISYADLVSRDSQAMTSLCSAATGDGFFYLELKGTASSAILPDVADLMTASAELFKLPLVEKMEFDTNKLGTLKNYG